MCFFDPFDLEFRNPNGAIKTPGTLRLKIKLQRAGGSNYAVWVLCRIDGGEAKKIPMAFTGVAGMYDVYVCELTFEAAGLYWYQFLIDTNGASLLVPEHGEGFQVTAFAPDNVPEWIQGGVIYHIFVDRFCRGGATPQKPGAIYRDDWGGTPHYLPDENGIVRNNDFFSGDIYGIIEKLSYLKGLGITCIYLSPVFEAASNHKYDTGDFMKIDPGFGGDEAFEKLCAEAKKLGIHIMLDGVFNHVGVDSRYFNKYGNYDAVGAYQSKDSPYYSWFNFHEWPHKYDAWWGIELLPAINERHEDYQNFICGMDGVIAHWTKKGVAGWRLDVVDELPDAFLDPLCQAIKREKPNSYIVGEVWEDASNKVAYSARRRYFAGGQLDSVTNYPLKDAIIAFVTDGDAPHLAAVMGSLNQNYPAHVLHGLMNILGTHDTMRILTVLGGEHFPNTKQEMEHFHLNEAQLKTAKQKLKLAAALQFTLPGVPCVYYGDEAGMEGGADPFCRRCYPWGGEDEALLTWYAQLAQLRQQHPAFKDGDYILKQAKDGVFAFTRGHGIEQILVVVNNSQQDVILNEAGFNYELINKKAATPLPEGSVAGIHSARNGGVWGLTPAKQACISTGHPASKQSLREGSAPLFLEVLLIRGGEAAVFAQKQPDERK